MEDTLKLKGWTQLVHRNRYGDVIDERILANTVSQVGKEAITRLMVADVGGTAYDWMAIGTGTPATPATALNAEILTGGGVRRTTTGTSITTTTTGDTAQFITTWTFTSAFPVTEAGLFNANTGAALGAVLLASQSFAAINVVNTDTLMITWKVTLT